MEQLKRIEANYGWIFRYATILILAGLIYFADQRYPTREEIKAKEEQLHKMRAEDIRQIEARINQSAINQATNLSKISEMGQRLSRIEAQNEIIIRGLEKLTQAP